MNSFTRFIVFAIAFVGLTTAHAANPREELKQLTAQLQSNPSDTALREKIIKLARTIRPSPAIPAEAERFDGRGEYAFKNAKSEADYLVAAQEFEQATNAAPWIGSYYFNAGTAYEKAQRPKEAKRNFEFYLLASPDARDAREVRRRIAGLEFAIEKANTPKERERRLLHSLEGAVFVSEIVAHPACRERNGSCSKTGVRYGRLGFIVRNGQLILMQGVSWWPEEAEPSLESGG